MSATIYSTKHSKTHTKHPRKKNHTKKYKEGKLICIVRRRRRNKMPKVFLLLNDPSCVFCLICLCLSISVSFSFFVFAVCAFLLFEPKVSVVISRSLSIKFLAIWHQTTHTFVSLLSQRRQTEHKLVFFFFLILFFYTQKHKYNIRVYINL
jgi:hypothetical protein